MILTSAMPPRMKPTNTLARLTSRSAMPPTAMIAPARMKNGIASSEKPLMPPDTLSITASSGMSVHSAAEDGGEPERIGDRHAQQAYDGEGADEDEDVHGPCGSIPSIPG